MSALSMLATVAGGAEKDDLERLRIVVVMRLNLEVSSTASRAGQRPRQFAAAESLRHRVSGRLLFGVASIFALARAVSNNASSSSSAMASSNASAGRLRVTPSPVAGLELAALAGLRSSACSVQARTARPGAASVFPELGQRLGLLASAAGFHRLPRGRASQRGRGATPASRCREAFSMARLSHAACLVVTPGMTCQ